MLSEAVILAIVALLQAAAIARHELWLDEAQAWGIARSSRSIADLWRKVRLEGHPPLWHLVLFALTRLTGSIRAMQAVAWLASCATAAIVLFKSPFRLLTKAMLVFGYFTLFEYGQISRNYVLTALFLTLALVQASCTPVRWSNIAILLSLTALTSVFAALLAVSVFSAVFLADQGIGPRRWRRPAVASACCVGAVAIAALAYSHPPSNSSINASIDAARVTRSHTTDVASQPLPALLPVPTRPPLWGTLASQRIPRRAQVLGSGALLAGIAVLLRRELRAVLIWVFNSGLYVFTQLFVYTSSEIRHVGFLALGLLAAYWLFTVGRPAHQYSWRYAIPAAFAAVHALSGIAFTGYYFDRPFAESKQVADAIGRETHDATLVGDDYRLVPIAAYLDQPYYSSGLKDFRRHLDWSKETRQALDRVTPVGETIDAAVSINKESSRPVVIVFDEEAGAYRCSHDFGLEARFDTVKELACAVFLVDGPRS